MDFFDDLGKKIGRTAKVVGDKSQSLIEMGKLNVQIGREEATLKDLYHKLGLVVYKAKIGEGKAETIDTLCQKIQDRIQYIDELKKRAKDLRA